MDPVFIPALLSVVAASGSILLLQGDPWATVALLAIGLVGTARVWALLRRSEPRYVRASVVDQLEKAGWFLMTWAIVMSFLQPDVFLKFGGFRPKAFAQHIVTAILLLPIWGYWVGVWKSRRVK